jgi:putative copper resistance protein D
MILLAGFLEVVFRAALLAGFALAVGGVAFGVGVLWPLRTRVGASPLRRSLGLVAAGAGAVAAFQAATLAIEPSALGDELGRWPMADFLATGFARAGLVRAAVAAVLAVVAARGRAGAARGATWGRVAVGAGVLALCGAPLVHGASRLAGAAPLEALTVAHQVAAGIWWGGLVHLLAQRRALAPERPGAGAWAMMVTRFSPIAASAVACIAITGGLLGWRYIATPRGLVGTAYGAMVLTKVGLLGAALLLGAGNLRVARRWRRGAAPGAGGERRVRTFVAAEAGAVLVILLAAAALTSQPPAVDVQDAASVGEVAQMFAPKRPRLVPPPHRELVATAAASLDPYAVPGPFDRAQSDFNHNLAGLLVLTTALGALAGACGVPCARRHWPLGFLPLAAFLLLIAEPNGWPLGPEPFFATLLAPSVLLHRISTALVAALAVLEWRIRAGGLARTRWRFGFPLLAMVGGAMLLVHSHSAFATRSAYLIEVSHNAIGLLSVLLGLARWLELRAEEAGVRRAAALTWPTCMALIGLVLLFYRET